MNSSGLGALSEHFFFLKDKLAPLAAASRVASLIDTSRSADDIAQGLHPALLILGSISVEIDDLAVVESDSESLFNEHITLLFFSKSRTPSLAVAARGLGIGEGSSVIDESLSIS